MQGDLGADTMVGGAGNDLYVVNSAADQIVELQAAASTACKARPA
ncbi:hypothetical protein [Paracoccus mutanolyticus]